MSDKTLERLVKEVLARSLSTGHADTIEALLMEVLSQYDELNSRYRYAKEQLGKGGGRMKVTARIEDYCDVITDEDRFRCRTCGKEWWLDETEPRECAWGWEQVVDAMVDSKTKETGE